MKRILPPKYHIIRDEIILELSRKPFRKGDLYGTEASLCERFSASRNTIRHALKELELSGYINRTQRQGITVHHKSPQIPCVTPNSRKILLMLPEWNYVAGNPYIDMLNRIFNSKELRNQSFQLQVVLYYHTPMEIDEENIFIVIAIDPPLTLYSQLESWSKKKIKIIAITPGIDLPIAVNIGIDIQHATRLAVKYFVDHGHKNIGMLTHFSGNQIFPGFVCSFIAAMTEFELPILPGALCDQHLFVQYGEEAVKHISAFLCINRAHLEILCKECHKYNLSIPGNISVIGTDQPKGGLLPYFNCEMTRLRSIPKQQEMIIAKILLNPDSVPDGAKLQLTPTIIPAESVAFRH